MTTPFNFFITPHAYWAAKLADPSESPKNTTNQTPLNEYQIFWYSSLRKVYILTLKFIFIDETMILRD